MDQFSDSVAVLEGIWIQTPEIMFVEITLEECRIDSKTAAEPLCARIEGPAGTGKTVATRRYALRFPHKKVGNRIIVPVLWMRAPDAARSGAFVLALMKALGLPVADGQRVNFFTDVEKILRRIRLLGIELIIIDEFHQIIEGKHNEVNVRQADNVLKHIIEDGVPVVICGLPHAVRALGEDSQVKSRFRSPMILSNYNYRDKQSQENLCRFLYEVDIRLPFPLRSGLGEREKALPIYQSSSGNHRLMMRLIRRAGRNALKDGAERIEMGHLERAFETEMREVTGMTFPNPFRTLPSPQSIVAPGSWVEVDTSWIR